MSRIIDTVIIEGVELERSTPRIGTTCKCCGKNIVDSDYVQTSTESLAVAYVCTDCITHKRYGHNTPMDCDLIKGKLTSGNYRFAIELEAMYRTDNWQERQQVDAYLCAKHRLQPTQDSSVDVEYHMQNGVNFHGLKAFLESVSKQVNMTSYHSGQHINISKLSWTAYDLQSLALARQDLFRWFAEEVDENDIAKVFGRSFNNYARPALSLSYPWLKFKEYNLEFRLAKFQTVQQYFYCCCLCREWVDILDDLLHNKFTLEKTQKRLKKAFYKYLDGKATCQRGERNKVER